MLATPQQSAQQSSAPYADCCSKGRKDAAYRSDAQERQKVALWEPVRHITEGIEHAEPHGRNGRYGADNAKYQTGAAFS